MRFKSLPGKWLQLRKAPPALWCPFICGWLSRRKNDSVPCVMPDCARLLFVPLKEFYASYGFFCEQAQGRNELHYFLGKLNPRETLYDIGGFRGAYSTAAKIRRGTDISVHIFEPLKNNVEAIRRICELNGFDDFKINSLAAGDGSSLSGNVNEQDAMLRLGDKKAGASAEFPSISLDEYVGQGNPPPTIIKLDVDGFELHALRGAAQCLARHHPRLWIEIHPQFLAAQNLSADAVLDLLRQRGYKISFFDDFHSPDSQMSYHIWCE